MEREQKEGKDGKRGWGGRLGMGGDLMGRKGCFGEVGRGILWGGKGCFLGGKGCFLGGKGRHNRLNRLIGP